MHLLNYSLHLFVMAIGVTKINIFYGGTIGNKPTVLLLSRA